jgi:hypothetical protein
MSKRERGGFKASRHGKASPAGDKSLQKKAAEHREAKGATPKAGTRAGARNPLLRGARINPRVIDGTETVVQLVEGTFQAYNSGRLREACTLYSEKMLKSDVTVGLTLTGALTPAGLGMAADPAHRGGVRRLDHQHRCEPVPRYALRAGPRDAPRDADGERHGAARTGRGAHLRHLLRLRRPAQHGRVLPEDPAVAGVPEADVERRVPLAVRQVHRGARAGARNW